MKKCSFCFTVNNIDAVECSKCDRNIEKIFQPVPVEEIPAKAPDGGVLQVIAILTWVGTIAGVGVGTLILVTGLSQAQSAPQEASVCAIALSCAILPYCFARAVTEIYRIAKD